MRRSRSQGGWAAIPWWAWGLGSMAGLVGLWQVAQEWPVWAGFGLASAAVGLALKPGGSALAARVGRSVLPAGPVRYSLAHLDSLDPTAFELAICSLLRRDGLAAQHHGAPLRGGGHPEGAGPPRDARPRDPRESCEAFRRGNALVTRFQFVADHQRRYGVKRLCTILGIARSSFYYWRRTALTGPPGRQPTPLSPHGSGPRTASRTVLTASPGSPPSSARTANASTTSGSHA